MLRQTSTLAILAALAATPAAAQTTMQNDTMQPGAMQPGAMQPGTMQDGSVVGEAGTIEAEVIELSAWNTDELYTGGMSAEDFIDEVDVVGAGGDEIGDVEDLIIGSDGRVIAVVAEIGGFIDIGDTHVAIPWDEIEATAGMDEIVVPFTEETIDDYDVAEGYGVYDEIDVTGAVAGQKVTAGIDDQPLGPRAFRVSELIGDYARVRGGDGETYSNYGYVDDVIIRDGQVAAVVVNATAAFGRGYYAYPYYPYGYGTGYGPYYDMPYGEAEIGDAEPFEYERLGE